MPKPKKPVIEYRHYSLPIDFPVLLLSGDRWRISDIKSEHLHFHNHMEIGICYSDGGIMEIKGESVPFRAGDITFIPRYLPHTTYSSPNNASLWAYIFFHRKNSSIIRSKQHKVTLNRIYGRFREPIVF